MSQPRLLREVNLFSEGEVYLYSLEGVSNPLATRQWSLLSQVLLDLT